ncbi:MAG: AraC family transcriptional regulator [Bacteroidota bacterium]
MPQKHIHLYPSIAAFAQSIGREVNEVVDGGFAILRTEELHGEGAIKSPPFRTAYYAFLLVESGRGSYTIDGQTFSLGPGSYYFTNPGHVKSFDMTETVYGYIICFTDRFLQTQYAGELARDFPFLFDQTTPVMQLDSKDRNRVSNQVKIMYDQSKQPSSYRAQILAHQMVSLLYTTKELLLAHQERIAPNSRPEEITAAFRRLLNDRMLALRKGETLAHWKVADYANALYIQPDYLSETVKRVSGKTVKQWIDESMQTEAETLLKASDLPVAQIAYRLGFNDASNFARFFKRRTGLSPAKYRSLPNSSENDR